MLAEKKDRMFLWLSVMILSVGMLIFSYIMCFQNIPGRLIQIEQEIEKYEGADLSLLSDDELILLNPSAEKADAFQLRSAYKKLESTRKGKQICGVVFVVSIISLMGSGIGMYRVLNRN